MLPRMGTAACCLMLLMGVLVGAAPNPDRCSANAAYDQIVAHGVVGPFGEFNTILKVFNLGANLKKFAAGKALVVPTNAAMLRMMSQLNIDIYNDVNKPGRELAISKSHRAKLVAHLQSMAVLRSQFRTYVKDAKLGNCHLLAGTHDHTKGLKALVSKGRALGLLANPRAYKKGEPIGPHGMYGTAPEDVQGRKLQQEVSQAEEQQQQYTEYRRELGAMTDTAAGNTGRTLSQTSGSNPTSVNLGCGYNTFIAMPISTSPSGIDPGILSDPIFTLSAGDYTVAQTSGCSSSTASVSVYGMSEYQSSLSSSLGIGGSYGPDSFSASTQFSKTASNTNSYTAYTFSSGTQVTTNQYQLSSIGTLTLSAPFINAVSYIYAAVNEGVGSGSVNTYMGDFAQDYGTHFINLGVAGAIANVFLQTSASNQANLQANSVSFSTNAQAAYGVASGQLSASRTNSQTQQIMNSCASGTTQYQTVPSNVAVPFSGSSIDCTDWTNNLEAQAQATNQWATILDDSSLTPIVNIFSYTNLNWPANFTAEGLQNVANALLTFYEYCAEGAANFNCIAVPTTCPPGSFGWDGMCGNCFTSGSMCSTTGTDSCDPYNGVCNCANPGAQYGSGAPYEGSNCAQENPGTCWAQYSVSKGSHCVQNGWCNWGWTGSVSDCDADVFGCTCHCTPASGYGMSVAGSSSSCNKGGGTGGTCSNSGQTCTCPDQCSSTNP